MDEISLSIIVFLIIAGFIAAFVDSVVGGGGIIAVPALLFTGLPTTTVLGTNKLAGTMGSLTSTISFLKHGKINKKLVLFLFPLSLIGSAFGVIILQLIPSEFLKPLIVVLLVLVTLYTLFKKDWGSISVFTKMTKKTTLLMIVAAFGISFYDGFLGPGTGSFLIFSFLLLGFDFVESAGNAKVINFGSNLAALIMFIYFDSVHFVYGITMGIAMIFGALVGSKVAIQKGSSYVKLLFVAMTVLLIGKTCWDYLN